MSNQKELENLKKLENTDQNVDNTNPLLKLSKSDLTLRSDPNESKSKPELKEQEAGPQLLPKPGEPKSNLQPKLEEQQSSPEPWTEKTESGQEKPEPMLKKPEKLEPEPVPEEQEPVPEKPEPVLQKPVPEEPEPGLQKPEPVPEKPEPVLQKPVPEEPEPVPEKPEPVPEKPEPVLQKPVPEEPEPVLQKPEPGLQKPEPLLEKEEPWPEKPELRPDRTVLRTPAAVAFLLIAVVVAAFNYPLHGTPNLDYKSAPQIFQDKFKSLQKDFPGQSQDLWLRSGKMLTNHLNKTDPGEPATIILTAAQDAKHTLLCLGSGLAQSYAFAHNSNWLVIHGPSEAQYDDNTAKLHIDEKLSKGFESTHRAAVLSHLETLPSGALLILYKYCDHENAAYKNVALVLTVLLEDSSLDPDTRLPDLEEKVRDFLWQQFIISDTVGSHQEMDSDKLGGVWSRISHLVLPVLPVKSIEFGSCPFHYKGS